MLPFAAAMDQRGQQRFRNEALAAAALDHPHIVRVHAVGCERGVHYIAMQLIDGRSLADLIAGRRPPAPSSAGAADPTVLHRPAAGSASTEALARQTTGRPDAALYRQAAEWCAQAADALEHAHDQGVVHRDVKPANLLVDGCGHLWVADFGLAQLASDPGLTASGDLLGTPRYMSPEQAQAKHNLVDHRADVYALGATLYELLTGQVAVPGNTREEVFRRIAEGEPVPPQRLDRRVPPELETVCLKCLAKDPAERYQTAGELADDLRRFLADEPIRAKPPTARQRAARWVRRHPRAVAVGVLAVVVALAGGAAWERRRAADRLAVAEAEAAARQVAAEAEGLYRQGRYPEALAVARRAVDLLPHGGGWRLRDGVARLAADLELANSLEEARMEAAAQTGLDGRKGFGRLAALPGYRRAFQSYGVDVLGGDEQVIADRLRRSIAWSEIMTALDNWAQRADDPQERARVGRLAGAIGGESQGWIARARRASEARDAKGLAELAAAMLKDLPPPAVVNQVANYLEIAGAHKEGELLLRAGTRRYPGDFWLNLNLGRFLMWPGAPAGKAEAVEYTRAALSLRPASPGAWANLGAALGNADRWPEAEAADRRAIELAPRLAYAHSNLASSLARKGQFREAEAAARQAIELVPGEAYAHCNLADALFRQGRYREAEAAARRATELLPGLAEAHTGLSRALLHLGRPREAEAASRRVVELRPGVAEAHAELSRTPWARWAGSGRRRRPPGAART
ncbi:MAG: serine/threonine-protein kinase [Gemmataceae bacterium]